MEYERCRSYYQTLLPLRQSCQRNCWHSLRRIRFGAVSSREPTMNPRSQHVKCTIPTHVLRSRPCRTDSHMVAVSTHYWIFFIKYHANEHGHNHQPSKQRWKNWVSKISVTAIMEAKWEGKGFLYELRCDDAPAELNVRENNRAPHQSPAPSSQQRNGT